MVRTLAPLSPSAGHVGPGLGSPRTQDREPPGRPARAARPDAAPRAAARDRQQYVNGGKRRAGDRAARRSVLADASRRRWPRRTSRRCRPTWRSRTTASASRATARRRSTRDYCILPLDPAAAHRRGSARRRRRVATRRCCVTRRRQPDNAPLYRWMLNIAYDAARPLSGGRSREWRIDPDGLRVGARHRRASPRSRPRAASSNSDARAATILEDFDNDGHLDLMLSHMGIEGPARVLPQQRRRQVRAAHRRGGAEAACYGGLNIVQADYDNDGCIDVYVPRGAWFHDKGRHPGIAAAQQLRRHLHATSRRAPASPNGFRRRPPSGPTSTGTAGSTSSSATRSSATRCAWPAEAADFRLYLNRGDGTFVDVAAQSGIRVDGHDQGRRRGRLRQRRPARPLRVDDGGAESPVPQPRRARGRVRRRHAGRPAWPSPS